MTRYTVMVLLDGQWHSLRTYKTERAAKRAQQKHWALGRRSKLLVVGVVEEDVDSRQLWLFDNRQLSLFEHEGGAR